LKEQEEKGEKDEDSDLDDEKSDKPKNTGAGGDVKAKGKKTKKSEGELMDSAFMEESIGEKEFLEIGKELKFNELHLQMLWKQINEFQRTEVHFHQWFQYLQPIDVKKENPTDNPNLATITGIDKKKKYG